MVGLIQKTMIDLIEEKGGAAAVAAVREKAAIPVDRVFRIGDVYPDDEFQRLLAATCEVLNVKAEQAFDAFAEVFFKDATVRFGKWFDLAKNSHQFLIFQTTIHNTFASGVVDPKERRAVQDKTSVEQISDRYIVTHYRSPNKLCGLYKSLGGWVARYYGDEITIDEATCMLRGDDACEIHVKWDKFRNESVVSDLKAPGI